MSRINTTKFPRWFADLLCVTVPAMPASADVDCYLSVVLNRLGSAIHRVADTDGLRMPAGRVLAVRVSRRDGVIVLRGDVVLPGAGVVIGRCAVTGQTVTLAAGEIGARYDDGSLQITNVDTIVFDSFPDGIEVSAGGPATGVVESLMLDNLFAVDSVVSNARGAAIVRAATEDSEATKRHDRSVLRGLWDMSELLRSLYRLPDADAGDLIDLLCDATSDLPTLVRLYLRSAVGSKVTTDKALLQVWGACRKVLRAKLDMHGLPERERLHRLLSGDTLPDDDNPPPKGRKGERFGSESSGAQPPAEQKARRQGKSPAGAAIAARDVSHHCQREENAPADDFAAALLAFDDGYDRPKAAKPSSTKQSASKPSQKPVPPTKKAPPLHVVDTDRPVNFSRRRRTARKRGLLNIMVDRVIEAAGISKAPNHQKDDLLSNDNVTNDQPANDQEPNNADNDISLDDVNSLLRGISETSACHDIAIIDDAMDYDLPPNDPPTNNPPLPVNKGFAESLASALSDDAVAVEEEPAEMTPDDYRREFIESLDPRSTQEIIESVSTKQKKNDKLKSMVDCVINERRLINDLDIADITPELTYKPLPSSPVAPGLPPGMAGRIVEYFALNAKGRRGNIAFATGALCTAVAGCCGSAYEIDGGMIGAYFLAAAPSGRGKSVIEDVIDEFSQPLPAGSNTGVCYYDPTSKKAMFALMARNENCAGIMWPEMGRHLISMGDNPASIIAGSLSALLVAFSMKTRTSSRTLGYADASNNASLEPGTCIGFIGDFQSRFLPDLFNNRHLAADGTMARFTIMTDRDEDVIETNKTPMPSDVQRQIIDIKKMSSIRALTNKTAVYVEASANMMFESLFKKCANILDACAMTCNPQMMSFSDYVNRIGVRAKRIAACIAIANNPSAPVITEDIAEWACKFVMWHHHGIENMVSESSVDQDILRRDHLLKLISAYIGGIYNVNKSNEHDRALLDMGYVTGHHISRIVVENPDIFRHKFGASQSIRNTVDQMVRITGELIMTRIGGQIVYTLPKSGYRSAIKRPSIYDSESTIYRLCMSEN